MPYAEQQLQEQLYQESLKQWKASERVRLEEFNVPSSPPPNSASAAADRQAQEFYREIQRRESARLEEFNARPVGPDAPIRSPVQTPSTASPPPTPRDLGLRPPNSPPTGSPTGGFGGAIDDAIRAGTPPASTLRGAISAPAAAGGLIDFGLRVASGQPATHAAGGAISSTLGGIIGGAIGTGLGGPAGTVAGSMLGGMIGGMLFDALNPRRNGTEETRQRLQGESTPRFYGGQSRVRYHASWSFREEFPSGYVQFNDYPDRFPVSDLWGPLGPFGRDPDGRQYIEHGVAPNEPDPDLRLKFYWTLPTLPITGDSIDKLAAAPNTCSSFTSRYAFNWAKSRCPE